MAKKKEDVPVWADVIKGGGSGLVKGATGLLDLLYSVGSSPFRERKTQEGLLGSLENIFLGAQPLTQSWQENIGFYNPQTWGGELAESIGEFGVGGAGKGKAAVKAARAVLPGFGAFVGGKGAEQIRPEFKPVGQLAGALIAPQLGARAFNRFLGVPKSKLKADLGPEELGRLQRIATDPKRALSKGGKEFWGQIEQGLKKPAQDFIESLEKQLENVMELGLEAKKRKASLLTGKKADVSSLLETLSQRFKELEGFDIRMKFPQSVSSRFLDESKEIKDLYSKVQGRSLFQLDRLRDQLFKDKSSLYPVFRDFLEKQAPGLDQAWRQARESRWSEELLGKLKSLKKVDSDPYNVAKQFSDHLNTQISMDKIPLDYLQKSGELGVSRLFPIVEELPSRMEELSKFPRMDALKASFGKAGKEDVTDFISKKFFEAAIGKPTSAALFPFRENPLRAEYMKMAEGPLIRTGDKAAMSALGVSKLPQNMRDVEVEEAPSFTPQGTQPTSFSGPKNLDSFRQKYGLTSPQEQTQEVMPMQTGGTSSLDNFKKKYGLMDDDQDLVINISPADKR